MAKSNALGAQLYMDQYDLSNDTNSLGNITKSIALFDMTGIDKSAVERLAGQRDASIKWVSFLNKTNAHTALSPLPTADRQFTFLHSTSLGAPAASMIGKQVNYDPTRDNTGKITIEIDAEANAYWLDWGVSLTAGKRTDTTATNGSSVDRTTTSSAFGAQFYVHLFALTGTNVVFTVQDSADNSSFTAITGGAFTSMTAVGGQRIQTGRTQTIRRYLRVATSGTFSNAVFALQATINDTDMSAL